MADQTARPPENSSDKAIQHPSTDTFEKRANVFPSAPVEPVSLDELLGVPGPLMTPPAPEVSAEIPVAHVAQSTPGDAGAVED